MRASKEVSESSRGELIIEKSMLDRWLRGVEGSYRDLTRE